MTRSAWIGILIVLIVIAAIAAFIFRGQLKAVFSSGPTAPIVATSTDPLASWQTYATTTFGFKYPMGYTLNASYTNDKVSPGKLIHGVSVTVPATVATGTNLSADSYFAVEQLPRANKCTGDIYLSANVQAVNQTIGGVEYSVASSSGAAAGNRYEEVVYAVASSSPCTAVRYYVHSTAIGNYPEGTVREFDRAALLSEFDKIRGTLQLR